MNARPFAFWLLAFLALPLAVCAAELKRSPSIDAQYPAASIQLPAGFVAELEYHRRLETALAFLEGRTIQPIDRVVSAMRARRPHCASCG